jgi:hypothetical protein
LNYNNSSSSSGAGLAGSGSFTGLKPPSMPGRRLPDSFLNPAAAAAAAAGGSGSGFLNPGGGSSGLLNPVGSGGGWGGSSGGPDRLFDAGFEAWKAQQLANLRSGVGIAGLGVGGSSGSSSGRPGFGSLAALGGTSPPGVRLAAVPGRDSLAEAAALYGSAGDSGRYGSSYAGGGGAAASNRLSGGWCVQQLGEGLGALLRIDL